MTNRIIAWRVLAKSGREYTYAIIGMRLCEYDLNPRDQVGLYRATDYVTSHGAHYKGIEYTRNLEATGGSVTHPPVWLDLSDEEANLLREFTQRTWGFMGMTFPVAEIILRVIKLGSYV